jgi:hypothetical protein
VELGDLELRPQRLLGALAQLRIFNGPILYASACPGGAVRGLRGMDGERQ